MRPIRWSHAIAAALVGALGYGAQAEEADVKTGLTSEDWKYTLARGVTTREVTFYSDGVACWAKLFFPPDFSEASRVPGVVLGHGWAETHDSIEKFAARFAERGLVAMIIDYRGWGKSDGFVNAIDRIRTSDDRRFTDASIQVRVTRTRLLPMKQVEDLRNAISFLQSEMGVDENQIGLWGADFSGGLVFTVASMDARVKALAAHAPALRGADVQPGPVTLEGRHLKDAIRRVRTGRAAQFSTGYSTPRMVDLETLQAIREYFPFHDVAKVGSLPVIFIIAENEQLFDNAQHAQAAMEVLTGPKELIEVSKVTHFELFSGNGFEISSNAAAAWFLGHLAAE